MVVKMKLATCIPLFYSIAEGTNKEWSLGATMGESPGPVSPPQTKILCAEIVLVNLNIWEQNINQARWNTPKQLLKVQVRVNQP